MSREADELVEWCADAQEELISEYGGYPNEEYAVVRGHLVVARVEQDSAALDVYTPAQVRKWHRAVLHYRRENPDEDLWSAIMESMP